MHARRKSNRRQFLKGESMRDALRDVQWSTADPELSPLTSSEDLPATAKDYVLEVGRRAMACEFRVLLNAGQHTGAVEAATEALDLLEQLEDQLSIYRSHSEISCLNRDAFERECVVESQLHALLTRCVTWHSVTGGALDVTAGPLVKLWGFHQRAGRFPDPAEIEETLQRVGSQQLELNSDRQTVRFVRPGMEINLGSVGKGYALDRCAEILAAAHVDNYLIHGGHSSILARGARSVQAQSPEWRVALRHPLRPDRRLAEIKLSNVCVGTSGSGQQFFYHRGRRYGHVLDPRSGRPAEGVLSVTVLTHRADEADALATAFFVLGMDGARAFCEKRPDVKAVFVLPGTKDGTVRLEAVGADEELVILES
jgi:thiamine biosynthesis lipoprotein